MSAPVFTLALDCVPKLPRGVRLKHDELRQEWLLLAPERIIKLNMVAVEVLKRCNGAATLGEIVTDLAVNFAADRVRIEADVRVLIGDLAQKRLLDV